MGTKKVEKVQKIDGIDLGHVNSNILRETLVGLFGAERQAELTKLGATESVRAVQNHYVTKCSHESLVKCEICGGHSPKELDVCPYCGDGAENLQAAPVTVEQKPVQAEPANPDSLAVAPSKAPAPRPKVEYVGVLGEEEKPTEELLDRITKRIVDYKGDMAAHQWAIGAHLYVVHKRELWKLRTDSAKQPCYQTFNQYVEGETKIKFAGAYALMDAAAKFSQEEAVRIGMTKLMDLLKAPEGVQANLLEEIKQNGMTRRELRERVKQERVRNNVTRRDTGRKKMPRGKPGGLTKAEKEAGLTKHDVDPEGRLTVCMVFGDKEIPLYAKPEKRTDKLKPAKKLTDEPVGREEMDNGVVRVYSVVLTSEGLKLKIETRRPA